MAVDAQTFKQALAQFGTGIAVVTTQHAGEPIGLTVSAFSSLSLEPPLVLVCIMKGLFTYTALEESGAFAVNILSADQKEFGLRFAGLIPGVEDRFAGVSYTTAVTGSPILPGVLSWVDCRTVQITDGGDHGIFVGEVMAATTPQEGEPLLYHNRRWGTFRPEGLD
jgi:flavin reductase (DIM6/NTAB) family NADH-FMN oxidoreductase RutF